MKKLLLGAVVALLPLTGMAATVLGFQAGVGTWTHAPSGSITSNIGGTNTTADLQDGLLLSDNSEGYMFFALEHPVPLLPNLKYVNTKLSHSGSGNVVTTFGTYTTGTAVTTSFKLDQTDAILYYEILDNDLVSFDIGVNIKMLDGKAVVNADVAPFSATIPMLYAAAEIGLPADLSLVGEISTIGASGNSISDITAKVTYTTDFGLGVEAGHRTQSVKVEADSVVADITFSGVFAGVYFKF